MKTTITYFSFLILFVICSVPAIAQNFTVERSSHIIVAGTSTLHDWEMKTTTVKASGNIKNDGAKITGFEKISVVVPVETLKSGKKAMDENCYKALKSKAHPNIYFQLDEVKSISISKVHATGSLKIAGVKHDINLIGNFTKDNKGMHTITGEIPLLMTDYDVEPPSFMLGTITTGNEIKIKYTVKLKLTNTAEL